MSLTRVSYSMIAGAPVCVLDFGASTSASAAVNTAAFQAAIDSGATYITGAPGENYQISGVLHTTTSGLVFDGCGATITQVTANTSVLTIGNNGTAFVQTSDVEVTGWNFIGADNGLTTTTSTAIGIQGSATVPYSTTTGCQRIKVHNNNFSGFCIGVGGTEVNGISVFDNYFTGMKYHLAAAAGGYGVLLQTCFDANISDNNFVALADDRHAIYVSTDPSRTKDSDNVCKRVVIANNRINWQGISSTTGYESCMVVRGAFNITITGNVLTGGQGGIDYDLENAPGENITITGNSIVPVVSGAYTRAAISFLRSSGTYTASHVTIAGNSIAVAGTNCHGIQTSYTKRVAISGNTVLSTNNTGSFGVYIYACESIVIGDNSIYMGNGYAAILFDGVSDKVTVNRNEIGGANFFRFKFLTVPLALKFGYPRTFYVSADGVGGISVGNGDEDVVASAVSDPNGVTITMQSWVDTQALNITFSGTGSSVGWLYHRTNSGASVTAGVTNHSGVPLPAATNVYSVVGTILS